jgi:hypothetical protein
MSPGGFLLQSITAFSRGPPYCLKDDILHAFHVCKDPIRKIIKRAVNVVDKTIFKKSYHLIIPPE